MIDKTKRSGTCLCKAVRITVRSTETDLGACHCAICRKWSGGPLFELECGAGVALEGEENISSYESSSWAQRGFCRICGTHLFVKSISDSTYSILPVVFEDEDGICFNRQVFIDHKPSYYSFAERTKNITSAYIHEHFPETRENA